jgi:hypothetical protein
VRELLAQVRQAGYDQVVVVGDGDIADICRLTCLEMGVRVSEHGASSDHLPALEVIGTRVFLRLEDAMERERIG